MPPMRLLRRRMLLIQNLKKSKISNNMEYELVKFYFIFREVEEEEEEEEYEEEEEEEEEE